MVDRIDNAVHVRHVTIKGRVDCEGGVTNMALGLFRF